MSGRENIEDGRRDVDEDRDDKQQEEAHEHREERIVWLSERDPDQFRQIGAAVADGHHARYEVMHRAADDVADRNDQEDHRAELDSENHADDRSDSGDVQKLDQHVFPVWDHDEIDSVAEFFRGRFPVIRFKDSFNETSVGEVTDNQQYDAAKKPEHDFSF